MIDQTRLPEELVYVETDEINEIYDCIRRLVVRGAPAIGIAAAFGLAASVQHRTYATATELLDDLRKNAAFLAAARPTAVNLNWALERCIDCIAQQSSDEAGVDNLRLRLLQEAEAILRSCWLGALGERLRALRGSVVARELDFVAPPSLVEGSDALCYLTGAIDLVYRDPDADGRWVFDS